MVFSLRVVHCQHYTKGVNVVGATIKLDRLYINNRTIHNFNQHIDTFNTFHGKLNDKFVTTFTQCVNSYLGLLNTGNEYGNVKRIINKVNKNWLRYVSFNEERRCFEKRKDVYDKNGDRKSNTTTR